MFNDVERRNRVEALGCRTAIVPEHVAREIRIAREKMLEQRARRLQPLGVDAMSCQMSNELSAACTDIQQPGTTKRAPLVHPDTQRVEVRGVCRLWRQILKIGGLIVVE